MLSLIRVLSLAGAAILVALTAASITALAPIRPNERMLLDLNRQIGQCQLQRRPTARRACLAHLGYEMGIAENR
jgi:hypothetical protein